MAAEYNLYIDQGATYTTEIDIANDNGEPVDLTNATILSQMRRSPTSTTAYPFNIVITDAVNGKIQFSMTADQTATLSPGRYVYDAQYQINDAVVRFLKGLVTVYPSVTRSS